MNTNALIDKINHLPSVLNKDLNDYLIYLNARQTEEKTAFERINKQPLNEEKDVNIYTGSDLDLLNRKPKLKREFGGLKGFVTYMSDDFDEPLKEFYDYM